MPDPLENLSREDLAAIDAECDAFIVAWRRGESPLLGEFVDRVDEPLRDNLGVELVRTEFELRQAAGERPQWEEYFNRFPQWAERLREFADAEAAKDTDGSVSWGIHPTASFGGAGVTPATPRHTTQVPCERLGHYLLLEVLGEGGMGIVVRARDTKLEREVAIKLLAPELARNADARQRFLREAKVAASVRHDNVVTIHAVEEVDGVTLLVMELIQGESLAARLRRGGALPADEVARLGEQIANGLEAAHRRGLVHRDIKPANVLLETVHGGPVRAKITDFGLARVAADASITHSGLIAGTPHFMSPEQTQNLPIDHRTDLFSLGSLLYSLSTGRAAFAAESILTVLRRVAEDSPKPIRELNPATPTWLVQIIERLMAKHPDDRFRSATEVAEALRNGRSGQLPESTVDSQTESPPSSTRTRKLAIGGGSVLAFGLLMAFLLRSTDHEKVPNHTSNMEPTTKSGAAVAEVRPSPTERLLSDRFRWTDPEEVLPPGIPGFESGAHLSADGRTLWFHGPHRTNQTQQPALYRSRRASHVERFGEPELLDAMINGEDVTNTDPSLTADELALVFCSNRPSEHGAHDLWMSTRANRDAAWGPPQTLGVDVNSTFDEWEPALSPDGLQLVFHSNRPAGQGGTDLWLCRRLSRSEPFGPAENLGAAVNGPDHEGGAAFTPDGLGLLFHRGDSLHLAVRRTQDSQFGSAKALADLSHPALSPAVSGEGDQLLVAVLRPMGTRISILRRVAK